MITVFQAIILGLVQGFTELFPISSLGHSVIIPQLFGWNIHQNDEFFLTFLVATHLATATVLFIFFKDDWMKIIKGILRSLKEREIKNDDIYAKMGWLLVVGTIPAGVIGLLFEQSIRGLFASATIAAGFLFINGFILLLAEKLRKNNNRKVTTPQSDSTIAKLKWHQAVFVGSAQALALFPGISRSGASMSGGLLAGLDNESAARFSFLLATPIIGAAALLKLPSLASSSYSSMRIAMIFGVISAAISAYLSIRFLMKYFKTNTLMPFAIYCLIAGSVLSIWLRVK